MSSSSIVWTTLPVSYDPSTGLATVSVHLSPRLDAGALSDFPMTDWPGLMSAAKFQIVMDPSPGAANPIPATVTNPTLDSALWGQIFPPSTAVKKFHFQDNSLRPIWSYPIDVLHAAIEQVYAFVAQSSAADHPALDPAAQNPFTSWVVGTGAANQRRIDFKQKLGKASDPAGWLQRTQAEQAHVQAIPDPVERATYLLKRFYDRPSALKDEHGNYALKDAASNLIAMPRPAVPQFDFHEKIALLGDHPFLMRRLGLVIDLQFPFMRDHNSTGLVHVLPKWGGPSGFDVTPRTAYNMGGPRFTARPASPSSDVQDGLLTLEDPARFAVTQGDPDGEGHKAINFAHTMGSPSKNGWLQHLATDAARAGVAPAVETQTLPARRTIGFTISRKSRDQVLQSRFQANKAISDSFDANAPVDLYADDVLRGYRVDVATSKPGTQGPWISLNQRLVTYSVGVVTPSQVAADVPDESFVKAASATSDPNPQGSQDMYVHEAVFAWTGWSLAAPRPGRTIMPAEDDGLQRNPTSPTSDFPINSAVRVRPGSLPSMRFGTSYVFRARAVDLAGNSLPPADTTIAHETAPQPYKRYEPVPPPVLVLREGITEGESVEHLVIRSDGDGLGKADTYASFLNKWSDPGNYKIYAGYSERHVAPPKSTQQMAEQHGDFDLAFKNGADLAAMYRLGTREEGTFMDTRIASLDVPDGYVDGNPNQAAIVTPPQVPWDQRRQNGPGPGSLVAQRGDPLAPGEYVICQANQLRTPYLPDSMAGGCVFYAAGQSADMLSATWQGPWPDLACFRLKLLPLAAGDVIKSDPSNPAEMTISLPAATILTLRYASVPNPSRLGHMAYVNDYAPSTTDVNKGRHWMMTPYREVKLVHAVPRPLAPPLAFLAPNRTYAETVCHFDGSTMQVHSTSTGTVDVLGSWTEYLDFPTSAAPTTSPQEGHAFQKTIGYGLDKIVCQDVKQEFGDTKHRMVTYRTVGTTRYKEYFPAPFIADPKNITLGGTASNGAQLSIKSTARPLAPKIVYVVPTFKWVPSPDGRTSTRVGGGLRVYMDRPWYTSGEGERLAVLLQTQGVAVSPETLPYASRWGRDPVWDAKGNGPLTPAAFLNAAGPAVPVKLAELQGTVMALPFNVEFHPTRKLWFCDLEMDPGQTYFPFVSLALARYQSESLLDVEISPMVRADFAQLVPNRTLTTATPRLGGGLSVTVSGPAADNLIGPQLAQIGAVPKAPALPGPKSHRVTASIQQRDAGSVGEMGWNTIGNPVDLTGSTVLGGGQASWTGVVPLPAPNAGAERRLLVEEFEIYQADMPLNAPWLNQIPGYIPTHERLVYVDTMPVIANVRLG